VKLARGSFEVRFADGRPSVYYYWDDIAGRRRCREQTAMNRVGNSCLEENDPDI
jgi:hypothetical protein